MIVRRWGLPLLAALVVAGAPARGAHAQESPPASGTAEDTAAPEGASGEDARSLFLRGQAAYSQGDYEGAANLWERAYALEARVGLQFNLSQAYERLGRLVDAATALDGYVNGTSPDDPRLGDARARLAAIRERIGRTALRLQGGPEGAVLLVDGEDRGRLPRHDPLPLSPGAHELRVQAPGHRDFAASVTVPAGQVVDVGIEMSVIASRDSGPPVGPIVTIAVGGAALVAGLVLGGVALDQAGSAPGRSSPQADQARSLALVSDILWPVGAAAIAGGLIWLIVDLSSSSSEADTAALRVTPLVGPGLYGLSGSGRF